MQFQNNKSLNFYLPGRESTVKKVARMVVRMVVTMTTTTRTMEDVK